MRRVWKDFGIRCWGAGLTLREQDLFRPVPGADRESEYSGLAKRLRRQRQKNMEAKEQQALNGKPEG